MAEYKKPLSLEDFLSQFDEEPEEYKQGLKQFYDQKGNRKTVRVPFQDGNIVIKRNPSLRRKDDTPIVNYYFNNKEANIQTAKNLSRANEIFNLPATLSPLLSTAVGARMLVHRRGLNRAKSLYMKVDENLNIADAKNVTPGTSAITGTTTKGALQSKEAALQTRISQFQAGASKSTRDLNLTTDYAKNSLLKDTVNDITQALFNPNYKKLTKAEMVKGLTGDLLKAAEKRFDQTTLLKEKAVERNKLLAKGLIEKAAYEKIHGPGTYKEFQLAEKKAGNILDKERMKKLVQRDKEARKASKEIVVRDLTEPRSQFKDMKIQPEGARHHKSGINTSYPIYYNLPYEDAQKLRAYAKTFDAEFGDVLNNLVDVPGTVKHKLGNIHNAKLHVWLKKHGLDTPPIISPDAPVEVRMRVMQNYIVDLRRQAIKLKELMGGPKGTANVEDLTFIKPPLTKKDLGIN